MKLEGKRVGEQARKAQLPRSEWIYVLVSLLTLVSFTVAQAVYEVLAGNPDFLMVRRVGNMQLLMIIVVFNLLPALALFLGWRLLHRLHPRFAQWFLAGVYSVLFMVFFLQVHKAYLEEWQPFPYLYLLWLIPAAFLGFASLRFAKGFRSFVLALSPAVLLFPGLFLYRTWMTPADFLPEETVALQEKAEAQTKKDLPPIFLLVFDEFTLHALLDENGEIDGERFPNFKKLANESYWFRNATANADFSIKSIPVILTGGFPQGNNASYEAYPNNIFTLLDRDYDIYIHELITHFCIPTMSECSIAGVESPNWLVLKDIFYLYGARTIPKGLEVGIPDLSVTWGPFRKREDEVRAHVRRFQAFLKSLTPRMRRQSLVFFHHWLPHAPYMLTDEGGIYPSIVGAFDLTLAGNEPLLSNLLKSYLMQASYVDKQLGEFVSRLKELDFYDQSLVIVTSDHGVSWKPEAPGRELSRQNAEMILSVPLLIKTPFQREGIVSDRDAQHIDLLPTVVDVLKLSAPWSMAGSSLLRQGEHESRHKIVYDRQGVRWEFPSTIGLIHAAKLEPTDSPLLGQRVDTLGVTRFDAAKGFLDGFSSIEVQAHSDADEFPIYVSGWAVLLDENGVPDEIAVAVNGEIVAITSACCERPDVVKEFNDWDFLRSGWRAAFSSRLLRNGENTVRAYIVLGKRRKRLVALKTINSSVIYKTGATLARSSANTSRSQGEVEAGVRLTGEAKGNTATGASDMATAHGLRSPARERESAGREKGIVFGTADPSELIGEKLGECDIDWYTAIKGYLDPVSVPQIRKKPANDELVHVRGWAVLLDRGSVPEHIAIAVNGEIVAIGSPCCDRADVAQYLGNPQFTRSGWEVTFSSEELREGVNTVTAFVVVDAALKQLARLEIIENTIRVARQ